MNIEVIFMNTDKPVSYLKGFIPYALAAFLIGLVGGLTTVLGPAFVKDMNLPYNNTVWTALALAVSSAVGAPVLGNISDRIGRRNTLLLGLIIFTIGNILTMAAPSLLFMIFARATVGIGTAAVAPTVMSYIVTEFPPKAVAKGFSLYMLISSSAVIFGPGPGGFILERWNWRGLMGICVILSVIFLALCFFTHSKTKFIPVGKQHMDIWGMVFVIGFFSLALCIPSFGQNFGWFSPPFLFVLLTAVFMLAGLIIAEKKADTPLLSSQFIFRKTFVLSIMILFLIQGLMQANMTNMIVFVEYTQPENTVISGYAISIMYLGMALGSILLGPLADKYEPKYILTGSLLLTAIGCGIMLFFGEETGLFMLAASLGILGLGLGANATIFMKIVLFGLSPETVGSGTGIYGLFRDLAAPFGVAIFVPFFTNHIARSLEENASMMTASTAALNAIHRLAFIELLCIAAGIILVFFLPKIHKK